MRFFTFPLIITLLFTVASPLCAQDKQRLHHALAKLKNAKDDTVKVVLLADIGWDTSYDDLAVGLQYCQEALALAQKLNFDRGIMVANNAMGTIYEDMGDFPNALDAHMKSLTIGEKINDKNAMATSNMNMSLVYLSQKENKKAFDCVLNAYNIFCELHDTDALADASTNLGGMYERFDSTDKALALYQNGLIYSIRHAKPIWEAHAYAGIARCEEKSGDTTEAGKNIRRAAAIMDSLKNDYEISQTYAMYAELLMQNGEYVKAEKLLMRSLNMYRQIGMRDEEVNIWLALANLYEKDGDTPNALQSWKRYSSLKDSLLNENVLRHQRDLEAVYQNEKKENELKLSQAKNEKLEKEQTLQHTYIIALVGGCMLLMLFLFVLFNRNNLRKKTNEQLAKQNTIIEEKNKDITDSINYAKRIQEAILPAKEIKYKIFPDAFVLLKPRDIVSGDFYWFAEKNGKHLIAAVDCTGHGVPGAFMSMIGNAFLNEIVNEKGITQPSEILNLLREKIITSLRQAENKKEDSSMTDVKDGMDIALLSFDEKNSTVEFAGANNPLWHYKKSASQIDEISGDKFPIGYYSGNPVPFSNHKVSLAKGDALYIFTDGYADQFGGSKGKKFKYKALHELLLSNAHLPMLQQESILTEAFNIWRGKLEQVDDVLVIGIRV